MATTQAIGTEMLDLAPVRSTPVGLDAAEEAALLGGRRVSQLRRVSWLWSIAADLVGLVSGAALGLAFLALVSSDPADSTSRLSGTLLADLAFAPLFLIVFGLYGLYSRDSRRVSTALFVDLKDILHAIVVSGVLYAGIAYLLRDGFGLGAPSTGKVFALCVASAISVPTARALLNRFKSRSESAIARVIVVGTGSVAQTIASHLRSLPGLDVLGCVDDNPVDPGAVLGGLDELPDLCRALRVARVVVCFSQTHPERTIAMLRDLEGEVGVSIVPRYFELLTIRSRIEDLCGLPMIDVAPRSLGPGARFLKRTFDIVVSGAALVLLSPLFLGCAIAIKLTSPGPVFFTQERAGRGGRVFRIYKLRTMVDGAESDKDNLVAMNEADGPLFKLREDPRITRVGQVLRKTSIDELPQLFNVLRGDMSLVGPRPFVLGEADEIDGWARRRFDARPGMTGLWQVSGRNELSYFELCRLDYLYVASWSLWWDLKILWHTPAILTGGRGAS